MIKYQYISGVRRVFEAEISYRFLALLLIASGFIINVPFIWPVPDTCFLGTAATPKAIRLEATKCAQVTRRKDFLVNVDELLSQYDESSVAIAGPSLDAVTAEFRGALGSSPFWLGIDYVYVRWGLAIIGFFAFSSGWIILLYAHMIPHFFGVKFHSGDVEKLERALGNRN